VERVSITGGMGSPGSHLCERLLGMGAAPCRRALRQVGHYMGGGAISKIDTEQYMWTLRRRGA